MRSRLSNTFTCIAGLAIVIVILGALGCDALLDSKSSQIKPTSRMMQAVVELPEGCPLEVSDLVVMTSSGSYGLAADSIYEDTVWVQIDSTPKHQLIIVKEPNNNKNVLLAYDRVKGNGNSFGLSSKSTAKALILVNPFFLYTTADERDTLIARAVKYDSYRELWKRIKFLLQNDPENVLDETLHPDIYAMAIQIGIDVLHETGIDPASSYALGSNDIPYIEPDLHNGKVRIGNPTFLFYGADIKTIKNGDYLDPWLIKDKETLLTYKWQWGWPPLIIKLTGDTKTNFELANGRYRVEINKGFDFSSTAHGLFDWNYANGVGTTTNLLKGFVFLMDFVAGMIDSPDVTIGNLPTITIPLDMSTKLYMHYSSGRTWPLFEVIVDVIIHNIDNIIVWYLQGSSQDPEALKKYVKETQEQLDKTVNIIDNFFVAYDFINESGPFVWDLILAEQKSTRTVIKDSTGFIVTNNYPPNDPEPITGPQDLYTGRSYEFKTRSSDVDGMEVAIKFDWGDGSEAVWSDFVPNNVYVQQNLAYEPEGQFDLLALARDTADLTSEWSDVLHLTVKNLPVYVDIRPNQYPNHLSSMGLGDVQIAILGTDSLDVRDIVFESISLSGIAPSKFWYRDVSQPCEDEELCGNVCTRKDGVEDMLLMFKDKAIRDFLAEYAHSGTFEITLFGRLTDNTLFEGSDCVHVELDEETDDSEPRTIQFGQNNR